MLSAVWANIIAMVRPLRTGIPICPLKFIKRFLDFRQTNSKPSVATFIDNSPMAQGQFLKPCPEFSGYLVLAWGRELTPFLGCFEYVSPRFGKHNGIAKAKSQQFVNLQIDEPDVLASYDKFLCQWLTKCVE